MKKDQYFCDLCGKEIIPDDYSYVDKTNRCVKWLFGSIKMEWVSHATNKFIQKDFEHICKTCIGEIWNTIAGLHKG